MDKMEGFMGRKKRILMYVAWVLFLAGIVSIYILSQVIRHRYGLRFAYPFATGVCAIWGFIFKVSTDRFKI
jgi:hypothetical protein